jgi:glycine/D-amino acid oxidase-like deaminating enzyme
MSGFSERERERVIIVGGGIHGVAAAYYLSKRGMQSTIIESSRIAAAASGKSGGFLAREWGSGPTGKLTARNYIKSN